LGRHRVGVRSEDVVALFHSLDSKRGHQEAVRGTVPPGQRAAVP
jgi:hypothetical protein